MSQPGRIISVETISEHHITDDRLATEKSACYEICLELYPEHPDRLYAWFEKQPEKFSFGIGSAGDANGFTTGKRPSPIYERREWMIYLNLGVEIGRARFTNLPIYTRKRFTIDMRQL